jgi:hypothetical protein
LASRAEEASARIGGDDAKTLLPGKCFLSREWNTFLNFVKLAHKLVLGNNECQSVDSIIALAKIHESDWGPVFYESRICSLLPLLNRPWTDDFREKILDEWVRTSQDSTEPQILCIG